MHYHFKQTTKAKESEEKKKNLERKSYDSMDSTRLAQKKVQNLSLL
jgi:hypothetical protein